jgi:hypothetical protein
MSNLANTLLTSRTWSASNTHARRSASRQARAVLWRSLPPSCPRTPRHLTPPHTRRTGRTPRSLASCPPPTASLVPSRTTRQRGPRRGNARTTSRIRGSALSPGICSLRACAGGSGRRVRTRDLRTGLTVLGAEGARAGSVAQAPRATQRPGRPARSAPPRPPRSRVHSATLMWSFLHRLCHRPRSRRPSCSARPRSASACHLQHRPRASGDQARPSSGARTQLSASSAPASARSACWAREATSLFPAAGDS